MADIDAKPWVLFGDGECRAIESRVVEALDGWGREWLADATPAPAVSFSVDTAGDVGRDWWWAGGRNAWLAIGLPAGWLDMLGPLLAGQTQPDRRAADSSLLGGLNAILMRDLVTRLSPGVDAHLAARIPALEVSAAMTPDAISASGVARVECMFAGGGPSIVIGLGPELVLGWVRTGGSGRSTRDDRPESRWAAVQELAVTMEALVGEGEVSLEDLVSLAVGDVVKLDSSLEAPLTVALVDGTPVCAGYVGTQRGRRAVRLGTMQ